MIMFNYKPNLLLPLSLCLVPPPPAYWALMNACRSIMSRFAKFPSMNKAKVWDPT